MLIAVEYNSKLKPGSSAGETLDIVRTHTLALAIELVDIRTALGAEPAPGTADPTHGTHEPPKCCPAHAVEYLLELLKKRAPAPSSGN